MDDEQTAENSIVQQMLSLGEERMGEVVNQLLAHEAFVGAMQRAVTSGLAAKRSIDTTVGTVLGAVNVPSLEDVDEVRERLTELEDVMGEVEDRVRRLAERVGSMADEEDEAPKTASSSKKKTTKSSSSSKKTTKKAASSKQKSAKKS